MKNKIILFLSTLSILTISNFAFAGGSAVTDSCRYQADPAPLGTTSQVTCTTTNPNSEPRDAVVYLTKNSPGFIGFGVNGGPMKSVTNNGSGLTDSISLGTYPAGATITFTLQLKGDGTRSVMFEEVFVHTGNSSGPSMESPVAFGVESGILSPQLSANAVYVTKGKNAGQLKSLNLAWSSITGAIKYRVYAGSYRNIFNQSGTMDDIGFTNYNTGTEYPASTTSASLSSFVGAYVGIAAVDAAGHESKINWIKY